MTITDHSPDSYGWIFWIDRGGTFTDVIGVCRDQVQTLKLLSASDAYADAAVEGMRRMLGCGPEEVFPAARVTEIRMGTTVATNALLERKGARTLFVTTKGFADSLCIGDQARPHLFVLDIERPDPLYAGVIEARERLDAEGGVLTPLDEARLAADLARARADGFESVAVAFLHADLNPVHERRAGELAKAAGFTQVSLSHEVSPLPRFIPRAETTVVDAYLTPVLRAYVQRVVEAVAGAPLLFMTSAGGLVSAEAFRGRDALTSGPAGGVVGVAETARQAKAAAVLGFDMGGTSTDVCRYAGALERKDVAALAGVKVRAPMLDVETVAAGGGSILTFDGLRARVGPASAGADPGPACYGRGGPATITDANLVLGRLQPDRFPRLFGPNHDQPIDAEAARAAIAPLAAAMGQTVEAAAQGFIAIAVEHTVQAIRRISTERGFDPRDHALVAFGGAAGQIACWVADALGVTEVLCPKYASLLSAWGIGHAQVQVVRQAAIEQVLAPQSMADAMRIATQLAQATGGEMRGYNALFRFGLRYDAADAVLFITGRDPRAEFEAAHQRLFGFIEPEREIILATVEVEITFASTHPPTVIPAKPAGREPGPSTTVADEGGQAAAPVAAGSRVSRGSPGMTEGRALILRDDTQIAIAPGWSAYETPDGLIRLIRTTPLAAPALSADAPDPITLELFNRRFMGVAEAMGAALERTAQSVNIKERLDFSCALFDADGGLVANAPHMPVHLGSMGASVRAVRDRHPILKPGDAFALNNPYAGGTHLPDITVVMPVFLEGRAEASFYVAARGHHADVGGIQPGSMPPFSRAIQEEGVLLDALPIMRGGRFLDTETLAALTAGPWPSRAPARNIADLKAQLAACQAGAAAVADMIAAYGEDVVARYMGFVQANAEACVRAAIGRLTDGSATVPMDGGGEIHVAITVDREAGAATLDFTGTSAVLASNFNAPSAIVDAAALYVFRTLVDDDIPLNAGCLTPLTIILPEHSMLSPAFPAAVVAGNVETSQHLVDALYAALGVMANAQGSMNNFTFGDEARQYYETLCGGAGATANAAGASAIHTHMTNSRLTDPEILERRFPVRLEQFAVRRGSGGAGDHPGGDGAVRRLRFLEPMEAGLLSTRRDHAPQGLAGGGPAQAGRQRWITADGAVKDLAGCFSVRVEAGDAIEIETPGGGGFGVPPDMRKD